MSNWCVRSTYYGFLVFFFNTTEPTENYPPSLPAPLPILAWTAFSLPPQRNFPPPPPTRRNRIPFRARCLFLTSGFCLSQSLICLHLSRRNSLTLILPLPPATESTVPETVAAEPVVTLSPRAFVAKTEHCFPH